MLNLHKAAAAITLLPILCTSALPGTRTLYKLSRRVVQGTAANSEKTWTSDSNLGAFVRRVTGGTTACFEASSAQTHDLRSRSTESLTNVITPRAAIPQRGLRIVLRGNARLQNFPEAIAAFNRAAALWELRIQTIETIVIDVDFGPTLFGSPFDDDVVSVVDSQAIVGNALYSAVRERLVHGPYDSGRRSLYKSLPSPSIPTDLGPASGIAATSASLRALDLINSTAEPDDELADLGPPPAIAINSKFALDFNPADGIDPDKLDFEAIVLHDIGHVLGFVSSVGQPEINPSNEVEPSLWDLFRFRPDAATINDFASSERVLSSGGEQVFFAGGAVWALSTARPDGAGGDDRQASHWKDDSLTKSYRGIMDPSMAAGERQFITDEDLAALNAIGYRTIGIVDPTTVVPLNPGTPEPGGITAPPPGFGVLSHLQYSIIVPAGATQLKIDLSGNQDVDLFVRFGRPVVNQGHAVISDYRAATGSNSESLTLTSSSSPPLDEGIYYLAVANFGPGDADFTITASVTGGLIGHPPAVFNIAPRLDGDVLNLSCSVADIDADLSAAEVTLLDDVGSAVGSVSILEFAGGASPRREFQMKIFGMSFAPTARMVNLLLFDQTGNRGAASVDFGKAEAGALTLSNGSFTGSKLKLKVRGPASSLSVEINGRTVPSSQKIKLNEAGTKLTVKGAAVDLGLREGPNRVRVKNSNGWSNILVVSI